MKFVFDSSTLILLAKVDILIDITKTITVIIPEGVKKECLIKNSVDALLIARLIKENKIEVREIKVDKTVEKLQSDFRIGKGEAEAVWLAKNLNLPLAIDDGRAIKASKVIGLKFTTAIHLLLYLTSLKKLTLPVAIEKLDALSKYGRYNKRIISDIEKRLKGE